MSNTCVGERDEAYVAMHRLSVEESDRLMAQELWRKDKASAAFARITKRNRRRKQPRRTGPKLVLSSTKTPACRRPKCSSLTLVEWKEKLSLAKQVLAESRVARHYRQELKRQFCTYTSFLPFVEGYLETDAINRAGELGADWRRRRSTRSVPKRVTIARRGYENVMEQLRINAGFYSVPRTTEDEEAMLSDDSVSGVFGLSDYDESLLNVEEELEVETLVGRMAPTVWSHQGVPVYLTDIS